MNSPVLQQESPSPLCFLNTLLVVLEEVNRQVSGAIPREELLSKAATEALYLCLPCTVHGISCFLCFSPKFEVFNTLMILTFVGYTCCESLIPSFSLCFKVSLDEQTFYILIYSYLSDFY